MQEFVYLVVAVAAGVASGGLLAWKFRDRCAP